MTVPEFLETADEVRLRRSSEEWTRRENLKDKILAALLCGVFGVVGLVFLVLCAFSIASLTDVPPTTVIGALLVGILLHRMSKK